MPRESKQDKPKQKGQAAEQVGADDAERVPAEDAKPRGWSKGRKATTGEEPMVGGVSADDGRLAREESGTLRREGGSVHRKGRQPGGPATSDTASDRAAEGRGKMTGEEAQQRRAAKPGQPAKRRGPG